MLPSGQVSIFVVFFFVDTFCAQRSHFPKISVLSQGKYLSLKYSCSILRQGWGKELLFFPF
jgi:hypothetical protein